MDDLTDQCVDALLQALDQIAREHDVYEYGLPLHSEGEDEGPPMSKLREAVREWFAAGAVKASPASAEE